MPRDERDLFPDLDPGPGGLEALREKLRRSDENRVQARRTIRVAFAPAAAALLIGLLLVLTNLDGRALPEDRWAQVSNPALIRFGLGTPPSEAVTVLPSEQSEVAALHLESKNDIAFYWVASIAAEPVSGDAE